MTTNLYDILGVSRNATQEDVRRAYRRRALETHPDRMPQGASAAEKAASEERFRKINNAYEVLSDPQRRSEYDQYGAWPPQQPGQFASGDRDPFSDPFFRDPLSQHPFFRTSRTDPFGAFGFGPHSRQGGFTDPFVLFNSIFGDLQRAFESDPFNDPFGSRGFGPSGNGFFSRGFPSMMPPGFAHGGVGGSSMQTFGNGNGGNWVTQSWTSSTVNGVTHTKAIRKDSQGNEHVLYRYPDGTERRTVNGVEQSGSRPPRALLTGAPAPPPPPPPPPPPAPVAYPTQGNNYNYPAPPPYSSAFVEQPTRSRSSRHVHYDDSADRRKHDGGHHHGHDRPSQGSNWGFWRPPKV